ncbi:MAG: SCO family protein [Gammaproteobacteria bacterium]|nr:SCO family protein [Gammaproteobacteria bacterium]
MPRLTRVLPLFGLCLAFAGQAETIAERYEPDQALAISQAAIGRQVGDHAFLDRDAQPFNLASLRGRPAIVSMIYTSCHHVCPMITEHLARAVDIGREALGEDSFTVVTVGFDTAVDDPTRMRQYAQVRRIEVPDWYFLSGDEATVAALAEDLGFIFFASPKGFDHLAQTSVLNGDGVVYRQVYGQKFKTPALIEPLKELVFETPAEASLLDGWLDNVLLFCTVYDPASGRYKFDYSIFVAGFVGILCLGAVGTFIVRSWKDAV